MQPMVQELDAAVEAFLVPLRRGDGFGESQFRDLCSVLHKCAVVWAESESIPKHAANIFIDLQRAIENCSYAYGNEEGSRIQGAAFEVAKLLREILPSDEPST